MLRRPFSAAVALMPMRVTPSLATISRTIRAAEFYYLDGRARELLAPPSLVPGQQISFTDHESQNGRGERFLSRSLSAEPNGTWSKGNRAEIVFAPAGIDTQRTYLVGLEITQVVGTGLTPLKLSPVINGIPLAQVEVMGPSTYSCKYPAKSSRRLRGSSLRSPLPQARNGTS